ncbi:sulfatase-like hydrolase/transferase [Tomitella fengzijianii]|uniref:Sulfatase-like hydrolase/transferase n=2 Tax=Tomitella fengzijianii TaxID=2597660 RepID=A0A516X1X6_9ACTN|nr:sulfatase-like hydrolase/transferase [Tomitella fengzijianii]QDQ97078.1 sulfatase-like hydrolase/transferase [Tomitella fengzijianii]
MKVIYVDVDTLRPDHIGPYGYARDITPHLDEMASESVRFDHYFCSDSPCMPSRTALMSSRFGITNGIVGHGRPAAQYRMDAGHAPQFDRPLLGRWLGLHGFHTAAVSSFADRHRSYFFDGNFRENARLAAEIGGDDLHARLHPGNGAVTASWTTEGPPMRPAERELFRNLPGALPDE